MSFSSSDLPALAAPPASPRKRRKPGATGRTLEALVLASPGATLTQHKQESKWIPAGRGKPARVVTQRGPCDFSGTFPGGRHLVLDAKESEQVKRLNCQENHLPRHQVDCLLAHGAAGAVAGVLAASWRRGRLYWLDWRLLRPGTRQNSYSWDDLYDIGPASQTIHWQLVLRADAYFVERDSGEPRAAGGQR